MPRVLCFELPEDYYEERIRLALYYCKASEFVDLEKSLAQRLQGLDPRAGRGALSAKDANSKGQGKVLKSEGGESACDAKSELRDGLVFLISHTLVLRKRNPYKRWTP